MIPLVYFVVTPMALVTDYGRPVRKSPSLHDRKSTPTPKFLATAEAYFVCHIGPNFEISLIYAFIWVLVCPTIKRVGRKNYKSSYYLIYIL